MNHTGHMTAEHDRLDEARAQEAPWKKWGPYLSERQWGTVREDYSDSGNAWDYSWLNAPWLARISETGSKMRNSACWLRD
jgi:hypothetical protein